MIPYYLNNSYHKALNIFIIAINSPLTASVIAMGYAVCPLLTAMRKFQAKGSFGEVHQRHKHYKPKSSSSFTTGKYFIIFDTPVFKQYTPQ